MPNRDDLSHRDIELMILAVDYAVPAMLKKVSKLALIFPEEKGGFIGVSPRRMVEKEITDIKTKLKHAMHLVDTAHQMKVTKFRLENVLKKLEKPEEEGL